MVVPKMEKPLAIYAGDSVARDGLVIQFSFWLCLRLYFCICRSVMDVTSFAECMDLSISYENSIIFLHFLFNDSSFF